MIGLFARRRDGERGAILILTGLILTTLVFIAALAVDIGHQSMTKRDLHAIADIAAEDAVSTLGTGTSYAAAVAAADLSATRNNLPNIVSGTGANANPVVHIGTWSGTPGTFTVVDGGAGESSANAVEVIARTSVTYAFVAGSGSLTATAVATQHGLAGEQVGSYAANINTANSGLGALLGGTGTSAGLTLVGYNGLASSNVTLLNLINASGGILTTSNVLNYNMSVGQLLSWTQTALQNNGASATTLSAMGVLIADNKITSSDTLSLGNLITASTGAGSALSVNSAINVLTLLTAAPELALANGSCGICFSVPLTVSVGGTASLTANVSMSIIQAPQIAYGGVGTTARTAQVAVAVTVSGHVTIPLVLDVDVDLPLFVKGFQGQGTINAVNCTSGEVDIQAQPQSAEVGIGITTSVPPASPPSPSPVLLKGKVLLGVVTLNVLSGYVDTPLGASPGALEKFGDPGTPGGNTWSTTAAPPSRGPLSASGSSLGTVLGNTTTNGVSSGNLTVLGALNISQLSSDLLTPIFNSVDALVTPIINALGVQLAGQDTWNLAYPGSYSIPPLSTDPTNHGINCTNPALVQ